VVCAGGMGWDEEYTATYPSLSAFGSRSRKGVPSVGQFIVAVKYVPVLSDCRNNFTWPRQILTYLPDRPAISDLGFMAWREVAMMFESAIEVTATES
jgi:hypothetical protein